MREWRPAGANAVWLASCLPHWRRFRRAVAHPVQAQARRLQTYLATNKDTEFGRRHGFARMVESAEPVAAYQQSVPLATYDDYAPHLAAMAQGRQRVLTAEPVLHFELTSGSTAASKLIPYTATLKAEFQCGVAHGRPAHDARGHTDWLRGRRRILRRPGQVAGGGGAGRAYCRQGRPRCGRVSVRDPAVPGLAPVFAVLAPDETPQGVCYALYLELQPHERGTAMAERLRAGGLQALGEDLDRALGDNFHYACAASWASSSRPASCFDGGATAAYLLACQDRGQ